MKTNCSLQSIVELIESPTESIRGLTSLGSHVCRAIEGLLDHFFQSQNEGYKPDDINFFFELANRQYHWCGYHDKADDPYQHSLERFKLYMSRIMNNDKTACPPGLRKKSVSRRSSIICLMHCIWFVSFWPRIATLYYTHWFGSLAFCFLSHLCRLSTQPSHWNWMDM